MKKLVFALGLLVLPVVPAVTFAQGGNGDFADLGNTSGLGGVLDFIGNVITAVIPLIIGVAVLLFLFGVLKYVTNGGDPEKRTEARNTMIWGIIAIFVMVSVWGLVNVLTNTFALDNTIPETYGIPCSAGDPDC
jgi:heme/copper-type cytochrome/quinol oxidase subunit 2